MTKLLSLAASAALLIAAAPLSAHAAPAPTTTSVTVAYGDLDLNREAGAKALIQRLRVAATTACGGEPDRRDLKAHGNFEACHKDALTTALNSVNAPLVASLSGTAPKTVVVASR